MSHHHRHDRHDRRHGRRRDKDKSSQFDELPSNVPESQVQFYFAFYEPYEGNYYHMALSAYDEDTQQWALWEANRTEYGNFVLRSLAADPRGSSRCQPLIPVYSISSRYLTTATTAINSVGVSNEANWDCQSYVGNLCNALISANCMTTDASQTAWNAATAASYVGYQDRDFGAPPPDDGRGPLSSEFVTFSDDEE
jgi:hypothetical protein